MIMPRAPVGGWPANVALAAIAALTVLPLLLMVANAFTPNALVLANAVRLLPDQPTLANFAIAAARYPIWRWLGNSLFGAVAITLGKLVLSLPAGFAFARMRFAGRDMAFAIVVASMSFPYVVAILPTYIAVLVLGLSNTETAYIVPSIPYIGFYVFYLRQAFRALPQSMFDAAAIDGAGPLRQLCSIALPNILPAIAVVTVLSFMGAWNIYLWAQLVLEEPQSKTLVTGIAMFADIDARERLWGPVMACGVLSVGPVLLVFLIGQRWIGSAFAAGRSER
jgi:multiple sugar transport system permease protein/sn-glycerol 3-phosphate transport system permease protein